MAYVKKISYLIVVFALLGAASTAKAAPLAIKNAGFIQSSIWFSKEPFFAGDNIRIYSLIFNSRREDFKGKAVFYDNGKILGESLFSVLGNGGSETVWIDWVPGAGQHKISASIKDATLSLPGKSPESVVLENGQTSSLETLVEKAPAPPPSPLLPTETPHNMPTQANNSVENDLGKTEAKEIPTITNAVKLFAAKIDDVVSGIKTKIDEKKDEIKTEIQKEEAATQNISNSAEQSDQSRTPRQLGTTEPLQRPLNYLLLAALYFGSTILNYKFLLYPLILFLVYKISKFAIKSVIRA